MLLAAGDFIIVNVCIMGRGSTSLVLCRTNASVTVLFYTSLKSLTKCNLCTLKKYIYIFCNSI